MLKSIFVPIYGDLNWGTSGTVAVKDELRMIGA